MKFTKVYILGLAVVLGTAQIGCESMGSNTKKGAGIGAAAGAVVGGIIGHQSGKRNQGALIGAALGGAIGGTAGARMDKQAKELAKIAETKRTEQGIITKLKSDILFDTGKADLKPAAAVNLTKLADVLKKYPENVLTIKGYTDNTGSAAVNKTLSEKRATSVKETLVMSGVPTNVITVEGLGPANPVNTGSTPDARAQNRRVEIEITVDESKVPDSSKG